jgi:MFS family permease
MHTHTHTHTGVSLGTSGIGGIVAGFLADRMGKKTILAVTIMAFSLGRCVCVCVYLCLV